MGERRGDEKGRGGRAEEEGRSTTAMRHNGTETESAKKLTS
jgi:hypothetical protein